MGASVPPMQIVGETDEEYCVRLRVWAERSSLLLLAVHAVAIVGFALIFAMLLWGGR